MAHFAKLDENNVVLQVIVINDNELIDENNQESESKGIQFLVAWSGGHTNWKQTSYNGNIRKNYAGIGFTYQADIDAFVPPQPFPSWTLNNQAQWQPPVPMPTNGKMHSWDEATVNWIST
jgi:hypothetical protein